jgi:hypothetical protein
MRSNLVQITIRMVVAVGIALLGISAIGAALAYAAGAWMAAQEMVTKPFPSTVPKSEFRLSEQEELRKLFAFKRLPGNPSSAPAQKP